MNSASGKILTRSLFVVLIILLTHTQIFAQRVVINDLQEEQIRIQQLLYGSKFTSLANRPLWQQVYDDYINQTDHDYGMWSKSYSSTAYTPGPQDIFQIGLYDIQSRVTINTTVPYGYNNEAAWYGRGLNSELFFGGWISSDYLTISFRPQLVYQQNIEFEDPRFVFRDEDGNLLYFTEAIGNIIDTPFQFGPDPFSTISLGYTSIRAHYNAFEVGYSTEPLTWGANVQYPLLFSNNAPGMQHFFLGTRKPFRIPYVGNLEFSYIGAFPEDSDYFETEDELQENRRFINGINLAYSPAFISNFHVGFARAVQKYLENDTLKSSDFGLILDPFYLKEFIRTRGSLNNVEPRYHLNLVYVRWIWEESHFEIYGEFYREDFAWDSRDFLMEPHHNSGYSFGFSKLIFAPYAHFYKVNLEFVNMTPSQLQEVRPQSYYYANPVIRQGHTNRGQLLGAAIGPGSNTQYFSIDAYKSWGRYGIYFRRLADNNQFHYNFDRSLNRPEIFRQGFGDYWRNRTDLTIGTRGLIESNNFILSGEIAWTKLFNYGRYDYNVFGGTNIANFTPNDRTNLSVQFSISYRL
tara:strand:- start:4378 stop:6108 length:1731 start_codon:yes stop_codon:yes gene_type:complete